MSELRPGMPAGIWRRRRLAPHHTAGYAGRAFLTRPAERFERNGFNNVSVICFANATVSLRLGHGAGLTAPPGCHSTPRRRFAAFQGRQAAAAGTARVVCFFYFRAGPYCSASASISARSASKKCAMCSPSASAWLTSSVTGRQSRPSRSAYLPHVMRGLLSAGTGVGCVIAV